MKKESVRITESKSKKKENQNWTKAETAAIILGVSFLTMLAVYVLTVTWGLRMPTWKLCLLLGFLDSSTLLIIKINNWFNEAFGL